jgi:ABC-type branched-subunit amino acid transport system ATPase component
MTCLENVMTPLLVRGTSSPLAGLFLTRHAREEGARARKTALAILDEMGLAQSADRPASTLPYGLQRKLEIARALACMPPVETASKSRPRLLLLDEPAAGMNDSETHELGKTIVKVRDDFDVTILLIEHHMGLVMDISTHIVVLDRGALLAEGTPRDIRNDERVVAAYLGPPRERAIRRERRKRA